MKSLFHRLTLTLALTIVSSVSVTAQPKAGTHGRTISATAREYAQLGQYREVTAKIISVDRSNQQVVIRIDVPHLDRNTSRTPQRRGRGRPARPSYHVDVDHIDFDLPLRPETVFRKLQLPLEYDERGNIKEYSAAEKLKLKGPNSSVPGYSATLDEMVAGTVVKVQLQAPRAADRTGEAARPSVKMLVAVAAPSAAEKGQGAALKKKK